MGNNTTTNNGTPQDVVGLASGVTSFDSGAGHNCAVSGAGMQCWGYNSFGQLGNGNTISSSTPISIATGTTWQAVSAGYDHTMAIKNDGTLWAWGRFRDVISPSTFNEFSYGSTPQQIGTNANWQMIDTFWHAVALRTDGTLWTWGGN